MPLSKKEEARFWAWARQDFDTLKGIIDLQHQGFDVESYLRDCIDGKPKDPKHYWGRKEGGESC